ncbi:unnamed protein product [Allacma fusca]|uniref:ADP-ribosylhydrolase ARH3 n=1 Tax=Allacma fusca TaxID=39272 RepID=A0A8J2NWQ2_9HEXA|nr:unnamed protein product [Allacma fusca]
MSLLPSLNQWQGCLAGVLVGDCLGFPYEVIRFKKMFPHTIEFIEDDLEKIKIRQMIPYVRRVKKTPTKPAKGARVTSTPTLATTSGSGETCSERQYTDDTSMTITFAKFLTESNDSLDYVDLARSFSAEFIVDVPKSRGYGPGVKKLLTKFDEVNFKNVFQYATETFKGQGSMGNGSGMRISPVALYTLNDPDRFRLVDITIDSCRLTHTHPEGIFGGIFQALAVRQALLFGAKKDKPSAIEFLDAFETEFKSVLSSKATSKRVAAYQSGYQIYQDKIDVIKKFLKGGPSSWSLQKIKEELGNKVVSSKSIPTALFCFLASFQEIDFIHTDNHFQRAITLAFALGGDTDTIGGMTGAICGAYVGLDDFPENFVQSCEASGKILNVAEQLYRKCNNSTEV